MSKLLIVDDSSFMRLSIKNMVENHDFEVVAEAGNGKEAVEMYQKFQPDIVTMDITMPVMSGIEAASEIKKFDKNAKIVMVSAMGQELMIKEAILKGATTFIVKPFQKEKMLEVLNGLI